MPLRFHKIFRFGCHVSVFKGKVKAFFDDHRTSIRIRIHIGWIVTEIHIAFFQRVDDHKSTKIFHADSFIQEYMQVTDCLLIIGEIGRRRQTVRRGRRSASSVRRGGLRFIGCGSADFLQKLVDLRGEGVHVCIQGFSIFHLFHLSS